MNRILFYGGGNIAQAIISGLLSSGLNKNSIFYIDRNKANQLKLKKLGIKKYVASDDAIDLVHLDLLRYYRPFDSPRLLYSEDARKLKPLARQS